MGLKKSHAKMSHKQKKKAHDGYHISKVNTSFIHLLTSLTVRIFLSYEINFRGIDKLENSLRAKLDI